MAIAICRGKPLGSVFDNTNVASWGHCEEFDPVDFIDKMGVYDVVPRSAAAEKGCRVIRTRWVTVNKGSDDAPQLRADGLPRSSVVVAVTNTSSSQRHLT